MGIIFSVKKQKNKKQKTRNFEKCTGLFSPSFLQFSGKLRKLRKKKVLTVKSGGMNNS